jgi:hypothetical protein
MAFGFLLLRKPLSGRFRSFLLNIKKSNRRRIGKRNRGRNRKTTQRTNRKMGQTTDRKTDRRAIQNL